MLLDCVHRSGHTWPTSHVTCPGSMRARATLLQTAAASKQLTSSYLEVTQELQSGNQYGATNRKVYKQKVPNMFKRPRWHRGQGQNAAIVQQ